VALDSRFGHDELLGDLAVREAAGDENEDLALAGRDLFEHRRRWLERVGAGGEVFDQPPGDRGREQRFAIVDDAYRLEQAFARGVFEEESGRAGAEGAEDVLVEVEGRQHEHAGRRLDPGAGQPCGGLDPVHPGHADVHQDDVRSQLPCALDRLGAVACLADDLEVFLRHGRRLRADFRCNRARSWRFHHDLHRRCPEIS
jgi:hypothetical protein